MSLRSGTFVTDKVRLESKLGAGAMGEVWIAYHTGLRAEVAVKLVPPELEPTAVTLARFELEAMASARIKSPHVVRAFDHGCMPDGTPYIVMELLEGETLQERIARAGPLSVEQTQAILLQVGRALDAAHASGIVHRDVKPHNIMLLRGDDAFVKLLDFGSARQLDSRDRLSRPGMVLGSPAYVSRDVLLDPDDVDERADLWALGVTAFKCLTGELPFCGRDLVDVSAAILHGRLRRPGRLRPELGDRFDAWFARVFSRDAAERPSSGAEMAASFASTVQAVTLEPPRPLDKKRDGLVLAALSIGALVAAGMLVAAAARTAASAGPAPLTVAALSGAPVAEAAAAKADDELAPASLREALARERVEVPAGSFVAGCDAGRDPDCALHEGPVRTIELPAFSIDRMEVTVAEYARCVLAGSCRAHGLDGYRLESGRFVPSRDCNYPHRSRRNHPVNCVTHDEATSYCRWIGARLPTEQEWEKAARGSDGRPFPWPGRFATCALAVMHEGPPGCRAHGTWPVGSKPAGRSPFGAMDMAGNVREWVDAELAGTRVARGGSWGNAVGRFLRTTARELLAADTRSIHLGFRCAAD